MTDADLVLRKLAFMETCIDELQRLARPERIRTDLKEERFVTHTLQIAVQAALDVASHIVSADRLGEPTSNAALFRLLAKNDWMDDSLCTTMIAVAGFRNIVVHGYQEVDASILEQILASRLEDLLNFAATVRSRVSSID